MSRGNPARLSPVVLAALAAVALSGGARSAHARAKAGEEPKSEEEKPKSPQQEQAFQHFLRAQELYKLGRYREAIARLEAAVKLDPDAPDLWYNLGVVHEKLGDADEAIVAYERYLKLLGPDADVEELKRIRGFIQRLRGARTDLKDREAKRMEHRFTPLSASLAIGSVASLAATGVFSYLALHNDRAARDYMVGSHGSLGGRAALVTRASNDGWLANAFGVAALATGAAALTLYFTSEFPQKDDLRELPPRKVGWLGVTPLPGGGTVQLGMVF
jgi:tetratricopeptide (TPR) repeat protein